MRIIRGMAIVAIVAAGFMIASPPAQASDPVIGDASRGVAGFTVGWLLGEEFRQLLEIPLEDNPLAGNGGNEQKCLSAGHRDRILILYTTPESQGADGLQRAARNAGVLFHPLR